MSGGIDSSVLVGLARNIKPNIPCIVIGDSLIHPDVVAAGKLAKYWNLNLSVYLPNSHIIEAARRTVGKPYLAGDECVYIALDYASRFATDILAGDGIDEMMGGYWWHTHKCEQFLNQDNVFEHFWNELEPKHLTPMYRSAQKVNVNIYWPYLDSRVVQYIAAIPLYIRVRNGIGKAFWGEIAELIGVPSWIIKQYKRGFLNALG